MLRIEFEEPTETRCVCCGNTTARFTRFVYQDDNAFAVYYAQYTRGHAGGDVNGLIGLGAWGEGAEPKDRVAFAVKIWTNEARYQVGLVDAAESPWSEATFLGRILNRDEALHHPRVKGAFHITDHMVTEDRAIVEYFSGATGA